MKSNKRRIVFFMQNLIGTVAHNNNSYMKNLKEPVSHETIFHGDLIIISYRVLLIELNVKEHIYTHLFR